MNNKEYQKQWRLKNIEKECKCCDETKPSYDFYIKDKKNNRLDCYCKICRNILKLTPEPQKKKKQDTLWRLRNPDKIKNAQLKYLFGMTLQDYNIMLKKQNGVCAICYNAEKIIDKRKNKLRTLAVDHCHKTGKVRGLLCYECNTSLGKLKDDLNIIKRIIIYLENNNEKS